VDMYAQLNQVRVFLTAVIRVRQTLAAAQAYLPLVDRTDWVEFVDALDAVRLRVMAEQATARLAALAERLSHDSRGADAPLQVGRAAGAIVGRNAEAYAEALAALAEAPREQAEQLAYDALYARLREAHPALATMLVESAAEAGWPARLIGWDTAWTWG